jgi:hypothetical protein
LYALSFRFTHRRSSLRGSTGCVVFSHASGHTPKIFLNVMPVHPGLRCSSILIHSSSQ